MVISYGNREHQVRASSFNKTFQKLIYFFNVNFVLIFLHFLSLLIIRIPQFIYIHVLKILFIVYEP